MSVRMPSNCWVWQRRCPSPYSIHSYATMRSNNRRGRVRQLACCKTLANRANAAQSIACGSLQTSLVQQGFCKDLLFRTQPAKRVDFDGAALPDPDWRGEAKNSICRREGKPKTASVDAWDDAAAAIRHEGTTAPRKAPVAGQVQGARAAFARRGRRLHSGRISHTKDDGDGLGRANG